MSNDLWEHLAKAGISKCNEQSCIEINKHEDKKITKSYFFDCLRLHEGSEFYNVYITVDKKGGCDIIFTEVVFTKSDELGVNVIIKNLRQQLSTNLRSFLENKDDLT